MRQLDLDLDIVDSALRTIYGSLQNDGLTPEQIDAIFENKYGVDNATEDFGND